MKMFSLVVLFSVIVSIRISLGNGMAPNNQQASQALN